MQLRDYQRNAIDRLRSVVMSGRRRVCLVMPTGTGKSLTGSAIIHNHLARKASNSCAVYVHRQELAHQFAGTLEKIGVPSRTIIAGQTHGDRSARVTVAMVQSVDANPDMAPTGSMVLFDECFVGSTMVATPYGDRRISELREGDLVMSYDHGTKTVETDRIVQTSSKTRDTIVVLLLDGTFLECTPEHPFFELHADDYVPAESLERGDVLLRDDGEHAIVVCLMDGRSGQTVYDIETERDHNFFANRVLVHNCHHVAAKTWRAIAARYDQSVVLGLTATPERADGKGLGDVFNALEVILSTEEAVEQGYLVPCRVYAPSEYTPKLSADPTEVYLTKCPGQKTLVFATNCTQSRELVDTISKQGFRAAHIDGKTSDSERKRIIRSFASGETRVLSSVGVLTEGFDDPSAEVAIIARGADHAGTWLQIVGRVLRLSPGKSRADVYDLRGIVHKHGLPTDPRTFSLEGKPITHDSDRLATARCKLCGAVTRASITRCPVCGHERPPPKAPEIIRQQIKAYVARETTDQRSAYREKLESIARARGYKRGWVEYRMRAKYEPNDVQDRS